MFLRQIFAFVLIVFALSFPAKANDILFDSLQWNARVLVLTGERNDPLLVQQIAILKENVDALRERSIAVIRFDADNIYEMDDLSNFDYRGRYDIDADLQGYYEDEMNSDNAKFSVALFGKDGMFKEVWKEREEAVPVKEIFNLIDSMSMRQREIERKE